MISPNKVCMISSLHGPYDDRIYWKESLSLKKNGYEVIHISVGDTDMDFMSEHGIRLIRIGKKKYFNDPVVDKMYRILTLKTSVYLKIFQTASALSCDVYHFHDLQINKIASRLKKLPANPKIIYDVHEDYYYQFLSFSSKNIFRKLLYRIFAIYIKYWERNCIKKYDCVIAAVPKIYENFKPFLQKGRLRLIYNYTNMLPTVAVPYEDKKYDVIYSGQISESRSGLEILQVALLCRMKFPGIKFLLAGPFQDEKYEKKMRDFIIKNNLFQNVIISDPVRYDKVEELYSYSRIGLGIFKPLPIFMFGIQIKTFEYMVYGLPIICSNFGNIHRFVQESNSGISVNPENVDEIAKAVTELLTNKNLYSKLSKNGRFAANTKYNWKTEEEKLINIYKSL